jgi:hypothetical protein
MSTFQYLPHVQSQTASNQTPTFTRPLLKSLSSYLLGTTKKLGKYLSHSSASQSLPSRIIQALPIVGCRDVHDEAGTSFCSGCKTGWWYWKGMSKTGSCYTVLKTRLFIKLNLPNKRFSSRNA